MEGVDPISQGLFFAATQSASAQAAAQAKKQEKAATVKRSSFSNAMQKAQEEQSLVEEGLPLEIAGMSQEDAIIFLKDAADIAGNKLRADLSPSNFALYRQKVSQFIRYVVKNNYQIETHKRFGKNRKGQALAPQMQIVVINKELDEMADWLIHDHRDTLKLLAKMDEINGMLVDLMAR